MQYLSVRKANENPPALSAARERAKAANCTGQLKDLCMAIHTYGTINGQAFFYSENSGSESANGDSQGAVMWSAKLIGCGLITNTNNFFCPSAMEMTGANRGKITYSYSAYYVAAGSYGVYLDNLKANADPSATWLLGDGAKKNNQPSNMFLNG